MKEEAEGNIHGIKVSRSAPIASHLMYVDDLLIMCRANRKEAEAMMNCLSTTTFGLGKRRI